MKKPNSFLTQVLQKILSAVLFILVLFSMIDSNLIQGSARVMNYTAVVRGGSQRIVKLAMLGSPYEDQLVEIETILNELKIGGGTHRLTTLQSVKYQNDLAVLTKYWYTLKDELSLLEADAPEDTEILAVSERFFTLADEAVSSAEEYSDL